MMLKTLLFILLPPVLSVSTGLGCFRDQRFDEQQNTITDSVMKEMTARMKELLGSVVQMLDKWTNMGNHITPLQITLILRGLNL